MIQVITEAWIVKGQYIIHIAEREIKDTTDSAKSASYLDRLLEIDEEGKLMTSAMTSLFKLSIFNFSVATFLPPLPMGSTFHSLYDMLELVANTRTFLSCQASYRQVVETGLCCHQTAIIAPEILWSPP